MLRITKPLFIAAMLAMPLSAQANVEKAFSWAFSTDSGSGTRCLDCTTNNNSTSTPYGNVFNFNTSTGNTYENNVSVAGFSTTNDANDPNPNSFETAQIRVWNGLGVRSREDGNTDTQPHHAMDNDGGTSTATPNATPDEKTDNGDVDAALFSFFEAISLTSIRIGWENTGTGENDADISVLRYIGTETDEAKLRAAMLGKTFADLTSLAGGWEFVSHIANLANNGSDLNSKTDISSYTAGKSSSYWLISAFTGFADPTYTDAKDTGLNNAGLDFGNDYFKIAGLGGKTTKTTSQVPEPASLVLLALGLIGWRMSRNNQGSRGLADSALSTTRITA